ncbi:hypothetical protein [Nocardioides sp. YIM 152315]|uniref:hypothetical protein n=1 Tax=Nocardioides sp. YIM 152315 TaxID=3031760 RepID=UPI0023DC0FE5|nr:hypothetical protein [Nocardioides sp. YIM 152315]MDF1603503.1 hypothetical protein [Nocardioides sp. YIM 152315]
MTTSVDTQTSVAHWLDDFRACLAGTHGPAWRARAERELRSTSTALASDRQRAASWRRTREEIIGSAA